MSLAYVRYQLPEHIAAIVFLAVAFGLRQWLSVLEKESEEEQKKKEEAAAAARRRNTDLYTNFQAPVSGNPLGERSAPVEAPRPAPSAGSRMATAHFDGRHLDSANNLTVYIDDVETCSYDGGSTRSVEVTPGDHVIRVLVYNDAAEDTYWLGPFSSHFEPGTEYDISYG